MNVVVLVVLMALSCLVTGDEKSHPHHRQKRFFLCLNYPACCSPTDSCGFFCPTCASTRSGRSASAPSSSRHRRPLTMHSFLPVPSASVNAGLKPEYQQHQQVMMSRSDDFVPSDESESFRDNGDLRRTESESFRDNGDLQRTDEVIEVGSESAGQFTRTKRMMHDVYYEMMMIRQQRDELTSMVGSMKDLIDGLKETLRSLQGEVSTLKQGTDEQISPVVPRTSSVQDRPFMSSMSSKEFSPSYSSIYRQPHPSSFSYQSYPPHSSNQASDPRSIFQSVHLTVTANGDNILSEDVSRQGSKQSQADLQMNTSTASEPVSASTPDIRTVNRTAVSSSALKVSQMEESVRSVSSGIPEEPAPAEMKTIGALGLDISTPLQASPVPSVQDRKTESTLGFDLSIPLRAAPLEGKESLQMKPLVHADVEQGSESGEPSQSALMEQLSQQLSDIASDQTESGKFCDESAFDGMTTSSSQPSQHSVNFTGAGKNDEEYYKNRNSDMKTTHSIEHKDYFNTTEKNDDDYYRNSHVHTDTTYSTEHRDNFGDAEKSDEVYYRKSHMNEKTTELIDHKDNFGDAEKNDDDYYRMGHIDMETTHSTKRKDDINDDEKNDEVYYRKDHTGMEMKRFNTRHQRAERTHSDNNDDGFQGTKASTELRSVFREIMGRRIPRASSSPLYMVPAPNLGAKK